MITELDCKRGCCMGCHYCAVVALCGNSSSCRLSSGGADEEDHWGLCAVLK